MEINFFQRLANPPASVITGPNNPHLQKQKAEQRYISGIGRQETLRLDQVATEEVEGPQKDRCDDSSSP